MQNQDPEVRVTCEKTGSLWERVPTATPCASDPENWSERLYHDVAPPDDAALRVKAVILEVEYLATSEVDLVFNISETQIHEDVYDQVADAIAKEILKELGVAVP